jgi:hypothetical protein
MRTVTVTCDGCGKTADIDPGEHDLDGWFSVEVNIPSSIAGHGRHRRVPDPFEVCPARMADLGKALAAKAKLQLEFSEGT